MSATAPEPAAAPEASISPLTIRAALLPEEAGDFDREYRRAMAEATESLDLTGVLGVLRRWERVARSSADPAAHRRMLDHADRLAAGEALPTEPWSGMRTRLGL